MRQQNEFGYLAQVELMDSGGKNTHDKAKCKPWVTLDDMGRIVSAVMTLTGDALVSLNRLAEGMFATGEYQTHGSVRRRDSL